MALSGRLMGALHNTASVLEKHLTSSGGKLVCLLIFADRQRFKTSGDTSRTPPSASQT
jgi:hypothetical protein